MLSLYMVPRIINNNFKQLTKQFYTSLNVLNSKDSSSSESSSSDSSSSDSSDSDSDNVKRDKKNVNQDSADANFKMLNLLINKQTNNLSASPINQQKDKKVELTSKSTKIIDTTKEINLDSYVKDTKITQKSEDFKVVTVPKKVKDNKESELLSFEERLKAAAKNVAITAGQSNTNMEAELLSNLKSLKLNKRTFPTRKTFGYNKPVKTNIIAFDHTSFSSNLKADTLARIDFINNLSNIKEENKLIPTLSTWEIIEEKELKLKSYVNPENAFQEMIQWTEQGKLWHFPINNEQGMEEEEKVHFSEHVFLERHLQNWCPKTGPLRHFMELVCVGLSKNAFMTVEEKIGHIMWYKNYFEDKEDIFNKLKNSDKINSIASQNVQQIEA